MGFSKKIWAISVIAVSCLVFCDPLFAGTKKKRSKRSNRASNNSAPPAPNEAKETPGFNPMEIFGELGMTSLQPTDGDGTKFSGLGLGGGANYRIKAGSNLMIGLGGQLHYFSGSGDSDGVKVTTTAMTIQPGLSLMFAATPDVSLGGFFATDLFMLTGKYSTQSEDGSLSFNLKSFSQTIFGFRGIFAAGNGLGVGGQIAMGNGNIGIDFGGLGSLTAAFKSQTFALFVTKSL